MSYAYMGPEMDCNIFSSVLFSASFRTELIKKYTGDNHYNN